ncbi:MAG TPA: hypothetical protein VID75_06225, partial [Acidimicrobiales bacterium]
MGLGDKAKARRGAADLAAWQAQRIRVQSFIARVETFTGATSADGGPLPIELLEGEHALLVLPVVRLIEPRRLPSHFMGGTAVVTFHVAGGAPDEEATPVDTGTVTVTDRRTVFSGSLHTRTWDHSSVIGYHSNEQPPWTAIAVSDRQKVSGIRYDPTHAEEFRFALALGLARSHQAQAGLLDDLNRQLEDLDRRRPHSAPAPVAVGVASPPLSAPGAGATGAGATGAGAAPPWARPPAPPVSAAHHWVPTQP